MTTPKRTPVRLPPLAEATGELWTLLIDLAAHAASVTARPTYPVRTFWAPW